ncbi:MAG: hypothetical protein C0481_02770 [Phenylobacterium sp.]|uniref:E2/UBC family protein n=1 Tax=Phenylobacterium sp. TaxID=1871053 RepID=UPI0025D7E0FD|nr:E2/UBC family protein [Phenylobacterium sp.]MBA4010767.1 hypothetical protein [Phenylobacterium sp.]
MSLLFESDYDYLAEIGQVTEEDEEARFLIFKDFPLPRDLYVANGQARESVDVLYAIPDNYNTEGGDMFWVRPQLARADGKAIPNISGPGEDSRTYAGDEYLRWSRHWNNRPWTPKVDDIHKILDRLTWALANPDAQR